MSWDEAWDRCDTCHAMVAKGTATCKFCLNRSHLEGAKSDAGKHRYDLIDPTALRFLAHVLSYGARKYAPNNWRAVDNWRERYYSALMRHIEAWRSGEKDDPDSGMPHLAHVFTNAMFLLALGYNTQGEKQKETKPAFWARGLNVVCPECHSGVGQGCFNTTHVGIMHDRRNAAADALIK